MTMFRVGPAGIPASLKTDMNAVFNKKFGTSGQNYPPKQWPDNVNLMGALEKKTVQAASVCSFSDGADDVPMSSVIAHIVPTLTGKNAVNMVQSGKNLFDGFTKGYGINSTTGQISTNPNGAISGYIKVLPNTSYYVSGLTNTIHSFIAYYKADRTYISRTGGNNKTYASLTTPAECAYAVVYQYISNDSGTLDDLDNLQTQLEFGSSASSYEAYKTPTDYTANLGRTVYGGQADFVSGQGKETHEKVTFDGSSDENWTLMATGTYRYSFMSQDYVETNTMYTNILSDSIAVKPTSENVDDSITCRGTNYSSRRFYIFFPISNTEGVEDLETFKTWLSNNPCTIVYPPTASVDFTFDGQEIPSLLGVNNLWHEAGDTEAVYRSSGTVYQYPEGEGVSF